MCFELNFSKLSNVVLAHLNACACINPGMSAANILTVNISAAAAILASVSLSTSKLVKHWKALLAGRRMSLTSGTKRSRKGKNLVVGGGGGDHFWNEAQQITITLLAILLVYMMVAKGEVMAAFVLNPLLYALRGTREGLTSLSSGGKVSKVNGDDSEEMWKKDGFSEVSAKESVVRKWGSD
ncbi:hypothetical protein F2Q69_00000849 [Brassica cretica]|uniref:Uncharacterized protein n=1 Tax=Brassica cretica TaxID=69181 RepID=A0A8S9NZ67_BRACR|nr:hypothetical protein F2Q69_00000849 [Brassica cretica]